MLHYVALRWEMYTITVFQKYREEHKFTDLKIYWRIYTNTEIQKHWEKCITTELKKNN